MAAVSQKYWRSTLAVFAPPPPEWSRVSVYERPDSHLGKFFQWCEDDEWEGEWAWFPWAKPNEYMFAFSDYRMAMAFKLRWA